MSPEGSSSILSGGHPVQTVTRRLLHWYRRHQRALPWRETSDPWRILVSEIMLQQTRVSTVIPYYERFLSRYPDPKSLAHLPEAELLTAWSGLGYYSRARNLQKAARIIVEAGQFPDTYDGVRALPGVGPYTAAAIASIAFGLPYGVLDGNVARVAARWLAETGEINKANTKKRLQKFVDAILPSRDPGELNQALMELGATVCTPKAPKCLICPIAASCEGRRRGIESRLPNKKQAAAILLIEQTLLLIERRKQFLFWKQPPSARRLSGFLELPNDSQLPDATPGEVLGFFRHGIVNHSYRITVRRAELSHPPSGFNWISRDRLDDVPLSTTARKALGFVR